MSLFSKLMRRMKLASLGLLHPAGLEAEIRTEREAFDFRLENEALGQRLELDARLAEAWAEHLQMDRYDVVIAHDPLSTLPALLLTQHQKAQLVLDCVESPHVTDRGGHFTDHFGSRAGAHYQNLMIAAWRNFDRALVVTDGVQAKLRPLFEKPIAPLMNVRTQVAQPAAGSNARVITILNSFLYGRGTPEWIAGVTEYAKQAGLGIQHVGHAGREAPDAPSRKSLSDIEFRGRLDTSDFEEQVRRSRFVVVALTDTLPNHQIALSNRLFDAMAAERPVLAIGGADHRAFLERHPMGLWLPENANAGDVKAAAEKLDTQQDDFRQAAAAAKASLSWDAQFQTAFTDHYAGARTLIVANKKLDPGHRRVRQIAQSIADSAGECHVASIRPDIGMSEHIEADPVSLRVQIKRPTALTLYEEG